MGANVDVDDVSCFVEHNACVIQKNRSLSVHFEGGGVELHDPLADHILIRKGQPDDREVIEKVSISDEFPLLIELRTFLNFIEDPSTEVYSTMSEEYQVIQSIEACLNPE